jgi:hypothetical protein
VPRRGWASRPRSPARSWSLPRPAPTTTAEYAPDPGSGPCRGCVAARGSCRGELRVASQE